MGGNEGADGCEAKTDAGDESLKTVVGCVPKAEVGCEEENDEGLFVVEKVLALPPGPKTDPVLGGGAVEGLPPGPNAELVDALPPGPKTDPVGFVFENAEPPKADAADGCTPNAEGCPNADVVVTCEGAPKADVVGGAALPKEDC